MENLEVNTLFWRSKRVLLTGHTGFKGSWLSLWLQQLGADVSGFSLEPSSDPNLFTSAGVVKGMERAGKIVIEEVIPDVVGKSAFNSVSLVRFRKA